VGEAEDLIQLVSTGVLAAGQELALIQEEPEILQQHLLMVATTLPLILNKAGMGVVAQAVVVAVEVVVDLTLAPVLE